VVDKKRIMGKWRAEEEERHKGSLTQKTLGLHRLLGYRCYKKVV
jgi:hypothetical protein